MFVRKIKELCLFTKKKGLKSTVERVYRNYFHIISFVLYKKELTGTCTGIALDPVFNCLQGNIDLLQRERSERDDLPREFYIDETHGATTIFYLVYFKDELAGIYWVFRKGEYSRFFSIQDESTVELNYIFTLPAFRGNRLQAKAINFICKDLKEKGYGKVVVAVSSTNILSIKGLNRSCCEEFKTVKSYFSFVSKIAV